MSEPIDLARLYRDRSEMPLYDDDDDGEAGSGGTMPPYLPRGQARLLYGPMSDGYTYIWPDMNEPEEETRPYEPGDTVNVFPVTTQDGVQGYIVFRPDDVRDIQAPISVPPLVSIGFSLPLDDDDPNRPVQLRPEPGSDEATAVEDGEIVEAVWVLDDGTSTTIGPVERAFRADLGSMTVRGRLAGTLVASATALAQAMDRATPDKISAIGREFREHIKRIEEEAGDDDDTTDHRANLSTPV